MLMCWGKISFFKWTKQFFLNWLFLVLIAQCSSKCQANENGDLEDWKKSFRLRPEVIPHEYILRLEPRIEESNFLGEVTIYFTTTSPRKSVILHSRYLNITKVTLHSTGPANLIQFDPHLRSNRQQVEVSEWFLYEEHEFLVVKLKEDLEPGLEYALKIYYQGSFSYSRLHGFYTSSYNSDGNNKVLGTTQFEPNDARMAFPCFDEPRFKAVFNVEVVKPHQKATVVSNMPVLREVYDRHKGKYVVYFDQTPSMTTYTLCWVVSDFQVVEETMTSSGVLVRGLTRRGFEGFLSYATEITKLSVEYHEHYTRVGYILPKIDIISIPDFGFSAMENYGLVTFKETFVLINDNSSGYMDYFNVVNVVCHEVAHMWFGNLVTMKWWDELWLNEGFATFFSMKCSKVVQPELRVDELIYIGKKIAALEVDSVVNIHPLVDHFTNNDQLNGAFDDITYKKGHSLLQMIENTMGNKAFQQGISLYLNRFALRNTKTQDLCVALSDVCGLDICSLIEDWTKKPGYPLVTVEKQDNLLYLTQTRFIAKDKQNNVSDQWIIPIQLRTADHHKKQSVLLSKERAVVKLKSPSSWFKLNSGHAGFFIVNYPDLEWNNFAQYLVNGHPVVSHWSDRANLLNDACKLAFAGHIKYSVALGLFSYLSKGKESNYAPWKVASMCFNDIKGRLSSNGSASAMFSEHVRNLISTPLQQALETINRKKLSPFDFDLAHEVIFSLACSFKHPEAVSKAKHLLNLWFKNKSALNLDIKATVFKCGMSGEEEESRWERLWALHNKLDDPFERRDLRTGLTSVSSVDLHKKLLELSRDENLMRSHEYYSILSTMASKSSTIPSVWLILKLDFKHLEEKFSAGWISKLFLTVASNFDTKSDVIQVEEFCKEHPTVAPHEFDLKRLKEVIIDNMNWREKYEEEILNYLKPPAEVPA